MAMMLTWLLLLLTYATNSSALKVGVGIADVTGPIVEIPFMGYGSSKQRGTGLHTRQFSRAFIFESENSRFAFVSVDCGMMGDGVRLKVIRQLQKIYGGKVYNEDNVMISGTHSHSTPGGFLFYSLFDLSTLGFHRETFQALALGITKSITRATGNLQEGRIELIEGELLNTNINRSPASYEMNPEEERARYKYNVDKTMTELKIFSTVTNHPIGAIVWFPVHATSMNSSNTLVSSDNLGLASVLFEQHMNPRANIGKGRFVAAFASTNLGDASPNTNEPICIKSGEPCHRIHSTCGQKDDVCIAFGPGKDMFESTRMIATRLVDKALELWYKNGGREINGPVQSVHQYLDVPSAEVLVRDSQTNEVKSVRGCHPAVGYSFAAGTTDGPGIVSFKQGTTTYNNPAWNALRDLITAPSDWDKECHYPKPILIATGRMSFPLEWQPIIVSTQVALIGDLAFACVPGEFTTMSGRRLRNALSEELHQEGLNSGQVVIAGLCNTYTDYITTFEEYQLQRYEGASTLYGPYTLDIYLSQYRQLTSSLLKGKSTPRGPEPIDYNKGVIAMITPVFFDTTVGGHNFGDVLEQPKEHFYPGETVKVTFVSGNPRNDNKNDRTYLEIERHVSNDTWDVIATDANWETKFHWTRLSGIMGTSSATVEWNIPHDIKRGLYRIRHFGTYKYFFGGLYDYEGVSNSFSVG